MSSFEQRIEEILSGVYKTDHDAVEAAQAYAANFQSEGERKTRFVINRIKDFDDYTRDSLSNYVAVSIGGADASDLLALVQNTPIRHTILLEYDNEAADRANKYSKPRIEAVGGSLRVVIGDAGQQLEKLIELSKEAKRGGAVGLLCLCLGILHELPRRSPGFELRHYFRRLTSVFDRNLLFLSEPYLPSHDQDEMELRVSTIGEDRLFELLRHVNAHLFDNKQPMRKLSLGYVRAGFPLIMETLHKLLRYDSIPRLRHEMGERLTQFTSNQFLDAIRSALPQGKFDRNERVSDGFRSAYRGADVSLLSLDDKELDIPFSHVQISAVSVPDTGELALAAFQSRLPSDKFIFRKESITDKGITGSLELKNGENLTNCRAQVQLNFTDAQVPASAESDHLRSINSSDLSYLLNGQSPLHVMWFARTNEIRYAWARDEWTRLNADMPDWKTQASFTIRFSKRLTPDVVDEIYTRILEEARMECQIHDTLARSAPAESVVISIDPTTLKATDPKVLAGYIKDGGMTLVSSGYGKQVLTWYALLNPGDAAKPRMRLVAGFAEASLGQYHSAIGHLAAAVIGRAELSADDQQFLEYLREACDYHTGRVSAAEYVSREEKWSTRLTGVRAAEHRLEVLRQTRLPERDYDRRSTLLTQMREVVNDIINDPVAVQAQKIHARLMLLMAEGDDLNTQMIEAGGRIGLRAHAGLPVEDMASKAAKTGVTGWTNWQESANKIHADAADLGHPLLLADTIAARVTTYASVLMLKRIDSIGRGADEKPKREFTDQLIKEAEQAIEIYKVAGSIEGEVRVKLLIADLHDVLGEPEKGKAIASDVLPIAEAMNYGRLSAHAREHTEGKTVFAVFAAKVSQRGPMDQDIFIAQESDDNIRSMAKFLLSSWQAPADRIEMAITDRQESKAIHLRPWIVTCSG